MNVAKQFLKEIYDKYYYEGEIEVDQSIREFELYLMLALDYKTGQVIDGLSRDLLLTESYVYRALEGNVEKLPCRWTDKLEAVYRLSGSSYLYDAILGKIDVNALDDEAYLIGYWGDAEHALVQVASSFEEVVQLVEEYLGSKVQLEYNEEFEQWTAEWGNLLVTVKLRPAETLKYLVSFKGWKYKTRARHI